MANKDYQTLACNEAVKSMNVRPFGDIKLWPITYKKLSYCRNSAHLRSLRLSRSLNVTEFDTNRKPVCDFILVNNTKFHDISHSFPVTMQCWSNYRCWQGLPLFSALVLSNLCEYRHKSSYDVKNCILCSTFLSL